MTSATASSSSSSHSLTDEQLDIIDQTDSNWYFNQLSGTIPSTIGSLTNLQYLYDTNPDLQLSFERISPQSLTYSLTRSLTRSLDHQCEWYESDLSINRLNGTIPSTIASLTNLTTLYDVASSSNECLCQTSLIHSLTHSLTH